MKKIILSGCIFAAFINSISAQKLQPAKIPAAVKNSFTKGHVALAVKWEKEDGLYEASFKEDGHAMSELYSADGELKESEIDIPVAELPAAARVYMNAHYPGKKIKDAAKIIAENAIVSFEAALSGKDILFDASGKFIKEVIE